MKVFFATDIHLTSSTPVSRKDDFLESLCEKILFIKGQMAPEDVLILGGDTFNVSSVQEHVVNRFLEVLPANVTTIVGNHDMNRKSKHGFDSTSLSILIKSGRIKHLPTNPLLVGGVPIIGFDYDFNISEVSVEGAIVVAHKAICSEFSIFSESEVWTPSDIERQRPKVVFSGHDHSIYPPSKIGSSYVVRPGALSRGTRHTFNKVRNVFCAFIDFSNGNIDHLQVPCKPSEDVFVEDSVLLMKAHDELSIFISTLRETKSTGTVDILEIINSFALPEDVRVLMMRYLRDEGVVIPESLSL